MRYTPDGKHLLATDVTGRASVFPTTLDAWSRVACPVAGRQLTRAEWSDYLPGRAFSQLC